MGEAAAREHGLQEQLAHAMRRLESRSGLAGVSSQQLDGWRSVLREAARQSGALLTATQTTLRANVMQPHQPQQHSQHSQQPSPQPPLSDHSAPSHKESPVSGRHSQVPQVSPAAGRGSAAGRGTYGVIPPASSPAGVRSQSAVMPSLAPGGNENAAGAPAAAFPILPPSVPPAALPGGNNPTAVTIYQEAHTRTHTLCLARHCRQPHVPTDRPRSPCMLLPLPRGTCPGSSSSGNNNPLGLSLGRLPNDAVRITTPRYESRVRWSCAPLMHRALVIFIRARNGRPPKGFLLQRGQCHQRRRWCWRWR